MGYTGGAYIVCFLLFVMLLYQIMPSKYRWGALLFGSLIFYVSYEPKSIFVILGVSLVTWLVARIIGTLKSSQKEKLKDLGKSVGRDEKKVIKAKYLKQQRAILVIGIILVVGTLFVLKYYNFFVLNIDVLLATLQVEKRIGFIWFIETIGISYYVLQSISYMVDVYWGKIEYQRNPLKIILYLSFFPTLVQGPIALYSDVYKEMFAGKALEIKNIKRGYIRIIWGLFKKLVIADRLNAAVTSLYDPDVPLSGIYIVAAAIFFTVQEYMDFSGCVDIAIGSGEIFGIHLPENFRQPFIAKNASEFWRRWHITLGVWLKTYIFYPLSISKMANKWNKFGKKKLNTYITRLVTMAMCLFPVWLCNGIWHGPKWNYIFYGLFYFVIIMLELAFEPVGNKICELLHTSPNSNGIKCVRIAKTLVVIFLGEMLFRAVDLQQGFEMIGRLFDSFNISEIWNGGFLSLGIGIADYVVVILGITLVAIVGHFKERKVDVVGRILGFGIPIRWALVLGLIVVITIVGQYGPGFRGIDFIYAGF